MTGAAPSIHDLPQNAKFADVISVVIGDEQDFAQNSVPAIAMRDRRVKVGLRVADDGAQRGEIVVKLLDRLRPCCRICLRAGRRPIVAGNSIDW